MDIVKNEYTTREIGKPIDWNEAVSGPCASLPVMDWSDPQSGIPFMVSFWKPSAEDLELLNKGHCILLGVNAPAHPVVFVTLEVKQP